MDLGDDFCTDESAEHYGYYSDSDLEDDEDEKVAPPKTGSSKLPHLPEAGESRHEKHIELANKGKVVRIPDMAFVT
jgi:hypothetical protein